MVAADVAVRVLVGAVARDGPAVADDTVTREGTVDASPIGSAWLFRVLE